MIEPWETALVWIVFLSCWLILTVENASQGASDSNIHKSAAEDQYLNNRDISGAVQNEAAYSVCICLDDFPHNWMFYLRLEILQSYTLFII